MNTTRRALTQILAIISKDVKIDIRRKTELGSTAVFSMAAGIASAYIASRGGRLEFLGEILGLILVMVFISVFASLSSFIRESEQGTLEGLRSAPIGAETLFVAKFLYTLALIVGQLFIYIATFVFFSQSFIIANVNILFLLISSSLYFAASSSFSSALLVYSEAKGVLLPVTTLVLVLPFIQNIVPLFAKAGGVLKLDLQLFFSPLIASLAFIALVVVLSKYIFEAI